MRRHIIGIAGLLLLALPAGAQTPATPPATPRAGPSAAPPAETSRDGLSKAWGELLQEEKAKAAAGSQPPKEAEPSGRVLGVGTGRGQGGKAPALSEADKACQRSLQQ